MIEVELDLDTRMLAVYKESTQISKGVLVELYGDVFVVCVIASP
ncbi:hypothetical protein SAMN04487943_11064 [Gracilibacillus orientalis]|uniref:Uncharacterized protein n=1 Tax=Gracilibacillus orientalis TaxID=334253 RepID=A0A1I4P539_9BACI|nr:hypothetical protein SAMN04487943_11064 [Gracilibacillus orientalis]